MPLSILHNRDGDALEDDPGREAREDVVRVAAAMSEALAQRGVEVETVGVGADLGALSDALGERRPDAVINLCESLAGDSRGEMVIPCWLDVLGVPYTGSSALALGLSLHKDKAKELLLARGVATPAFAVITDLGELAQVDLPFPLIVKPSREDASVGIEAASVVADAASLRRQVAVCLGAFADQPVLIEQFIEGREIYVPLLGNGELVPLPLTEIRFGGAYDHQPRIVSYKAKWDPLSPECVDSEPVRCELSALEQAALVRQAQAAFQALGCRDYGRVDFRVGADGRAYVIDINPNCDLHPEAGFARAALASGIEYADLALKLVSLALERTRHGHSAPRLPAPGAPRRPASANRDVLSARGPVRPRAHRPRAAAE